MNVTQEATESTCMSYGGRVAVISDMFLGLVPSKTQEGDIVCCFFGAQTPMILRQRINNTGIKEGYHLVGTCLLCPRCYAWGVERILWRDCGRFRLVLDSLNTLLGLLLIAAFPGPISFLHVSLHAPPLVCRVMKKVTSNTMVTNNT
jgi:hypothetical protein